MNAVFHTKKSYRNSGGICLFIFVGMLTASVYLALKEGPILFGVVFGAFWSFWIGLSVWMLLAYYRESLTIRDGTVVRRGVVHTKSINLSELDDVQWIRPGVVVLRSNSAKVKVHFDNFTPEQRQKIIRWLHASTPLSIQRGWGQFCYAVAMPLLWRLGNYSLRQHILVRWHIDRIFLLMIPLVIGLETAVAWYLRNLLWLLLVPVPFLLLWLAVRAGIPAKGIAMSNRKRLDRRFLLELAVWSAVGIAGAVLFDSYKNNLLYPSWWGWIGALLWFGILLLQAHRAEQRMWHGERHNIELGVQEWEQYEAQHIDASSPAQSDDTTPCS